MRNIDWNFHINFSPMYAVFVIMCIILAADLVAEDEVIGHTFDGHAIHKSDTEIDGIRVDHIRGSSYNKENNTLNLKLKNQNVEVHFFNNCFELGFANNLGFRSESSSSKYNVILRKGDAFIPISFGQVGMPCRIKAIYEILEEEDNGEEN